jgi:hypothetical protein
MLALALLLALQAPAADIAAKPLTNESRAGDLMILQLWSDKPDAFLMEWNKPTPPSLRTTIKIERNKRITSFIIFAGCKSDTAGKCDLNGNIEFRDPEGKIYGEIKDVDIWSGPPIGGYNLRLSPVGPAMMIGDGEKLGDYTVRITVTDRNANVTAMTEEKLTVVEPLAK